MQKWEYMWIYVDASGGKQVYVANGERLPAQTYTEALNIVGKAGWELVAIVPPSALQRPTQTFAQFCLKRPLAESPTTDL
jgi:hypothetical protein